MSDPIITACICTVNRAAFLRACIGSLLAQTFERGRYEILVVDNGSTDDTPAVCAAFAGDPLFRYVREPLSGLSRSRNTGWRHARGQYVGYIDDDAKAAPTWLAAAWESFQTLSPAPQWVGGPIRIEWEEPPPAWMTAELRVPLGEVDLGAAPRFLEPGERLGGGNSFFSRRLLEEMGGFDVRLGRQNRSLLSGEETQFQHRIQAGGGRLYYHPGVEIFHFASRERVRPGWFYRRYYWGGRSDAVMARTLGHAPRQALQLEQPNESRGARALRNLWYATGLAGAGNRVRGRIYLSYAWGRVRGGLGNVKGRRDGADRPASAGDGAAQEAAGGRKGPAVSVLLPTWNRCETLARVLDALDAQDAPESSFEVVVADDGSSDGTSALLRERSARARRPLRPVILDVNHGPAAARNAALDFVRGKVVVIVGDDIVVPPDFVRRHLEWHAAHPAEADALLGRVTWPEAIRPTPFMRWLERGGRAFFFDYGPCQAREVDATRFYTCNVSVKRALLERARGFDESFRFASHEDLELGQRLQQFGMRLFFDPALVAWHWHELRVESIARRVYLMGYSAHTYWRKVPDPAGPLKRGVRAGLAAAGAAEWAHRLAARLAAPKQDDGGLHPGRWKLLLTLCYWTGLGDARRGREPRAPGEDRRG